MSEEIPAYVLADGKAYLHDVKPDVYEGYWGAKTSSVNFCESDYQHTPYIAETWNTISSLWIVLLPLIGLLYSNPTGEFRFKVAYTVLIIVGCGSITLHATLHEGGQKADELPMLWMCSTIFYCLADNVRDNRYGNKIGLAVSAFVIAQTLIYVQIQSLYEVFVTGYLTMVGCIVLWTAKKAWLDNTSLALRYLWLFSVTQYIVVGSSVWILDMYYCEYYQDYYEMIGGVTWHVLWHFSAGLASFSTIQQLIFLRLAELGFTPKVEIAYGCLPMVIKGKKGSSSSSSKAIPDDSPSTGSRRSKRIAATRQ